MMDMSNVMSHKISINHLRGFIHDEEGGPPGGGGTPIYGLSPGLYRYVPRDRVWFLRE